MININTRCFNVYITPLDVDILHFIYLINNKTKLPLQKHPY